VGFKSNQYSAGPECPHGHFVRGVCPLCLTSPSQAEQAAHDRISESAKIRTFPSGATRDLDNNKPDYEGYISPLVLEAYGRYMLKHQYQADGSMRASDNWTKGMPRKVYAKSLFRHFMDVWLLIRGYSEHSREKSLVDALCAMLFNTMGLLHEVLIKRDLEPYGIQDTTEGARPEQTLSRT
jgi:hypothetical protein